MISIAALVIGLPERTPLLAEAIASVSAQTRQVDDLVIGVDPRRYGEAENMNRLIDSTDCNWLAFLHDDDLWHSDHIATAESLISNDVDVIVSDFRSVGRPQSTFEPYHDNFRDLMYTNWFPPAVVIARKSVFGHWIDGRSPLSDPWAPELYDDRGCVRGKPLQRLHSNAPWIDWANWRRLQFNGARFVRTRKTTVDYRFGDWANGSWTPEQATAAERTPNGNVAAVLETLKTMTARKV